MASLTLQLVSRCPAGGHLTFRLSGVVSQDLSLVQDEILEALNEEEKQIFIKALVKLAKVGRTNQQLLTLVQTGFTVTI